MSIFISYSRQDQAYVNKLVQALKKQGLPVWLDDRIDYGDTWPRVIEENLKKCQVFLLVMSPRSRNSHWVNCELNLALELKKPIFPLLLEGSRWLEVEIIQTVDVHGGGLPPANFFDRVRAKLESKVNVPSPRNEVELKSERGIDYTKLRDLLAAGKWAEADQETGKVMLAGARKWLEKWLDIEDIKKFPCEDLRTINQLWLHYSKGKFGFSVQKEIYESLGGTIEYEYIDSIWSHSDREDIKKMWAKVSDHVGWTRGGNCLDYSDHIFNLELAPRGHLPRGWSVTRGIDWGDWGGVKRVVHLFAYLAQRLVVCKT